MDFDHLDAVKDAETKRQTDIREAVASVIRFHDGLTAQEVIMEALVAHYVPPNAIHSLLSGEVLELVGKLHRRTRRAPWLLRIEGVSGKRSRCGRPLSFFVFKASLHTHQASTSALAGSATARRSRLR